MSNSLHEITRAATLADQGETKAKATLPVDDTPGLLPSPDIRSYSRTSRISGSEGLDQSSREIQTQGSPDEPSGDGEDVPTAGGIAVEGDESESV